MSLRRLVWAQKYAPFALSTKCSCPVTVDRPWLPSPHQACAAILLLHRAGTGERPLSRVEVLALATNPQTLSGLVLRQSDYVVPHHQVHTDRENTLGRWQALLFLPTAINSISEAVAQ